MATIIESAVVEPLAFTPFPVWPGQEEARGIFVRRTPVLSETATRTLYVHGLGGSSPNWTDLMGLRMPVSPGIALDLPGFGFSAPAPRHTLRAHADAVIRLLDDEGCGPVDLVGNSMGGAASVLVAAQRPDLVRSLTLLGPALPGQPPRLAHLPILLSGVPGVRDKMREMTLRQTPSQRMQGLLDLIYFDPACVSPQRRAEGIAELERRDALDYSWTAFSESAQSLGAAVLQRRGARMWQALQGVRAPVLGLFGTHDKLVNVSIAPKVARRINRGRVVVMPRMGHVPQMEDPVQVADLMASFEREFLG
ncbi:MAG: alpha/beta fold hydrolase [bacterium]